MEYPEYIMQYLRQRADLDEDDTSMDDELNELSPDQALNEVLTWNGFLGYTETIKGWVEDIYKIDLNDNFR